MDAIIQGSSEWFAARCGRATASRFSDILAKGKSGEATTRRNYRIQLVTERLTGEPAESFKNAAMAHGTETEPFARMAYEAHSGNLVEEVGFVQHSTLMAGCSPDGLIDLNAGCEIKSPFQSAIHIETLESGMPSGHKAQVQGSLWVTGREWWDFISFDPRLPDHLKLYVQRIERDEEYIKNLEAEVIKFLGEVDELYERLMKR